MGSLESASDTQRRSNSPIGARRLQTNIGGLPRTPINRTLLLATVVVIAASLLLPLVGGYGTVLYQYVVLYGWHVAEKATSAGFAQEHRAFSWSVTAGLSVLVFLLPAASLLVLFRRRQVIGVAAISLWCIVFLASLFFLFRATDGP
jgi:hypothetical protein